MCWFYAQSVDDVASLEQRFGQVRAVLSGDSGDERDHGVVVGRADWLILDVKLVAAASKQPMTLKRHWRGHNLPPARRDNSALASTSMRTGRRIPESERSTSSEEIVFEDAPHRPDAIPPADLLSFGVGPAMVAKMATS